MPRTIRFHLDEHVAHAIAEGLRRRGVDVTTTTDAGLLGTEIGSREAGLLRLREPELDRAVLDRTKVLLRVLHELVILRSIGRQ